MRSVNYSADEPKLCLSLTEATLRENLAIVERERRRVDLVELRADFLDEAELAEVSAFPRLSGLPTLLTFRRESDGGARAIGEGERRGLLDRALDGGFSVVDLEEDLEAPELERKAAEQGTMVVRSMHDFGGVPGDLSRRLAALARRPGEIPKVAVMPHSVSDLLRLLEVGGQVPRAIVVGMGEWGFPTRVLPGRFHSVQSYCSAGEVKAAPGHVDPKTLRETYRLGETSATAKLFCVIGNPVLHSRSPWIHNPGYRALGLDAVYVPVQVDRLADFFMLAERLGIEGASVTVPHKEEAASLLAETDASVTQAGACNTLVRESGGWRGYNTDIEGFLAPLRARLRGALAGARALVVGAGGAARSVVAGLVAEGARVTVVNRTGPRARVLAEQFDCGWAPAEEAAALPAFDIVVQATSVGMSPNEDADPLPSLSFRGTELVYELIYAPRRTLFLARAERAGCGVIGGREMLLHQAYAQFRLFTGRDYPAEVREDF